VLNELFGVTLWCKTLVLRKDKVTHCSSEVFRMHMCGAFYTSGMDWFL